MFLTYSLLLFLLNILGSGFSEIRAETYGTLLFDTSKTMNNLRDNDQTRCEFGKERVISNTARALGRVDFINIVVFGNNDQYRSLTNGFKNIQGFSQSNFEGIEFLYSISRQLINTPCNATKTALGDAICRAADELRLSSNSGDSLRLAMVTDGGENDSLICGGNDYINEHIFPKIVFTQPPIIFDISVLSQEGGNVYTTPELEKSISKFKADKNNDVQKRAFEYHVDLLGSERAALQNLAIQSGGQWISLSDKN